MKWPELDIAWKIFNLYSPGIGTKARGEGLSIYPRHKWRGNTL
jgi:hypothetical protein